MPTQEISCAICGGARTRRLYTKSGLDIARCIRCGLVYANPRAPVEAITARYSSDYFWREYLPALGVLDGHFDLTRFDARYRPLLDLVERAPGRRLFEVGSGAGFFLKAAERSGWSVRGIELSAEGARFAREQLALDVRQESAESFALAPGEFDAAAMFDTIEHLFDPRMALTTLARGLAPGGMVVITTPNFGALSRRMLGSTWAVLSPLEHMYYFEERTLRALVESCGFSNVRFVRRHAAWSPQETMNFLYTHSPRSLRWRVAGLISRLGGYPFARAMQRAGCQDILICVASR